MSRRFMRRPPHQASAPVYPDDRELGRKTGLVTEYLRVTLNEASGPIIDARLTRGGEVAPSPDADDRSANRVDDQILNGIGQA